MYDHQIMTTPVRQIPMMKNINDRLITPSIINYRVFSYKDLQYRIFKKIHNEILFLFLLLLSA